MSTPQVVVVGLLVKDFCQAFDLYLIAALRVWGWLITETRTVTDKKFVHEKIFLGETDNLLDEVRKIVNDDNSVG